MLRPMSLQDRLSQLSLSRSFAHLSLRPSLSRCRRQSPVKSARKGAEELIEVDLTEATRLDLPKDDVDRYDLIARPEETDSDGQRLLAPDISVSHASTWRVAPSICPYRECRLPRSAESALGKN